MHILIYILCLVFTLPAYTQYTQSSCNVNVLSNPGVTAGIREHFNTPFDQGSTETCYAHVASDLLTFRSGQSISPLGAAFQLAIINGEEFDPFVAGEIVDVIEMSNDGAALCNNSGYDSRSITANGFKALPPRPACSGANLIRIPAISGKFYRDCLQGYTPRRILSPEYRERILSDINAELDRQQPVGLQMDMAELTPASQRVEGKHAMTVIGRVWKNNRCEIVIRNSYGAQACGEVFDESRISCEVPTGFPSGTFSMSENMFKQALVRVFIMNPPDTGSDFEIITPSNCQRAPESARAGPAKN